MCVGKASAQRGRMQDIYTILSLSYEEEKTILKNHIHVFVSESTSGNGTQERQFRSKMLICYQSEDVK